MRIAFIGFGTISSSVYEIAKSRFPNIDFCGVYDPFISDEQSKILDEGVVLYSEIDEIVEDNPDVVIEAANSQVAREAAPNILGNGIDFLSLSTGAYADGELIDTLDGFSGKLYLSGGAMPCADMVRSACVGDVDSVEITTTKPVNGLAGAKGISIKPNEIKEKLMVFEGSAREAIKLFPKNVNIAVTISLAGIGVDRTRMRIFADPDAQSNMHEVKIVSDAGEFYIKACGKPSNNPKTSKTTAYSVVSLLDKLQSRIKIG